MTQNKQSDFSTDLLRIYYDRLFPYDVMFNWLSYGNDPKSDKEYISKDFFQHREWSFTIEDDIYIRYQSFKDKDEMMAAIQKKQPHKIDIGAVFSASPKDHAIVKPELFKPVERELVFDIDMDDYNDVRHCCEGANICTKCWPFMTMAVKVLDRALREDFGFKHFFFNYSGRRGIHCWVCDPEARSLSNEARSAVVDYLSVKVGSKDNSDRKVQSSFNSSVGSKVHPLIKKSYHILLPYFEKYIVDGSGQGLLADKVSYRKVLNSFPNESIRVQLDSQWEKNSGLTGIDRWNDILDVTAALDKEDPNTKKRKKFNYSEIEAWLYELVFTHCYPKLDANVSKTQNHLLKSPFCIHPKTGRVCVPINPTDADDFNPFEVPTVRQLCEEVDAYHHQNMTMSEANTVTNEESVSDIEKTSLQAYMDTFDTCFMKGMWQTIRKGFIEKKDQIAAVNIDF